MDQRPDLLPLYIRELEELLPVYRRKALRNAALSVLLLLPATALAAYAVMHPSLLPSGSQLAHGASRLLVVLPFLPVGFGLAMLWPLLRPARPTPALLSSGLAERVSSGLLTADPIYDYAPPSALRRLPGRLAQDYRGQAERLCRWLQWYLRPATRVEPLLEQVWVVAVIAVAGGLAAMVYLSPYHGVMILGLGLGALGANTQRALTNCGQVLAYFRQAATGQAPRDERAPASRAVMPADASLHRPDLLEPQPEALVLVERQHRMALVLNEVEEQLMARQTKQFDGVLPALCIAPLVMAMTFRFFSSWMLLPLPVLAVGALLVKRSRSAYRGRVRDELARSDLAQQLASAGLDLDGLRDSTLPCARFTLRLPKAAAADGLRGALLTAALNVDWFLHPRRSYFPAQAQLVLAALTLPVVMLVGYFGLEALITQGLGYGVMDKNLWHSFLASFGPLLIPGLLFLVVVGLTGTISGGKSAIAAQEFIACLRARLTA